MSARGLLCAQNESSGIRIIFIVKLSEPKRYECGEIEIARPG